MNATNKVVSKVSTVKTGESEFGKWTLFNIFFEGSDKKFGYLGNDKRPVPFVGMKVPYLEYDIEKKEKDGKEYTNYNIKELKVDEEQKTPTQGQSQASPDNKPYINHGQVIVDLIKLSVETGNDFFTFIREFNSGMEILMKGEKMKVDDVIKTASNQPSDDFDSSNIPLDDIPF
jgi:hypothetical protein